MISAKGFSTTGLVDELRDARRQTLTDALDRIERAIEELYPDPEGRLAALVDPKYDWPSEE